jgi:glycosyltransferase involved in cell wall biosynthesis
LQDVVTLSGPRPQAQVKKLVQNAAVMAAPSVVAEDGNRDGLPTVLLEAMALGTACVATDVTGIPEVIQHEQTGLIVAQHDPEALSWALERLLNDGQLRHRLATAARKLIEAEFDATATSATIRRIFDAGAAPRPAPPVLEEALP